MGTIPRNAVLLCLLFAPLTQTAAAADPPAVHESLDQVVVEGTRAKANEMLRDMVKLEDHFFARYNELNTRDEFDVRCFTEARVGTLHRRRACRAVYMTRALEAEGQEYALFTQNNAPSPWNPGQPAPPPPPVRGGPPVPALVTIEGRRKEYQKNMADVARRNPELIKLLEERYALGKRYEAMRREALGLKPLAEADPTVPDATDPRAPMR